MRGVNQSRSLAEFVSGFPALTGTLSLALFIHNCVLSIIRNQEKPENNVGALPCEFTDLVVPVARELPTQMGTNVVILINTNRASDTSDVFCNSVPHSLDCFSLVFFLSVMFCPLIVYFCLYLSGDVPLKIHAVLPSCLWIRRGTSASRTSWCLWRTCWSEHCSSSRFLWINPAFTR